MQVLRLIQNSNYDLDYNLGEEIGYGADGQVFLLTDQPDRVIKFCVLYDCQMCANPSYEDIHMILSYLIDNKPDACARVYSQGYLGSGSQKMYNNEYRNYILYYYVMEKLYQTTDDERKVFHSILSHEDRKVKKNYSIEDVRKMLVGMQCGLDFDFNKVFSFYNHVKRMQLKHEDLHVRNIMKDTEGNFKLIDFDRARLGE